MVGIVALPLAIAFGIASGVSPSIGLVTAIIGGFLVSALDGVFVQIGLIPNSGIFKGQLDINERGEIVTDDFCRTSQRGVYAAGDVSSVPYKQIVIAIGEGAKAALTAFDDRLRTT